MVKIIAKMKHEEDEGNAEIGTRIRQLVGPTIEWEKISSRNIPDDNHEATISSYGEPKDIDLDFDIATYYGDGQLGIPFTCEITVSAFYYIFKANYYAIDEEDMPSVRDHNSHYFEAESDFEILVSGNISVRINLAAFGDEVEVEDYVDYDSIEMGAITSIDILGG